MDWELEAVKARLKVAKLKAKNRELKERLADYEDNGWIDDLEAEVLHLNALAESLKTGIEAKDAEIARLKATIDRTVNAWESRCIEKYDEIKRLNIVIDELILRGDDMLDDLCWLDEYTTPENRASMNAWSEFVNQLEEEREKNV